MLIAGRSVPTRPIPVELAKRYEDEGWWTQDTLGDLLARGLEAWPDAAFCVHSNVRPFSGTYRDVELVARRLAAGLRARGVGSCTRTTHPTAVGSSRPLRSGISSGCSGLS
jgi:non-ribosomal peptide synthetase component E (peptide arylation enzyme)